MGRNFFFHLFWKYPPSLPFPLVVLSHFLSQSLQSTSTQQAYKSPGNTCKAKKYAGQEVGRVNKAVAAGLTAAHLVIGRSGHLDWCSVVWYDVWWWCCVMCSGFGVCGGTVVMFRAVWISIISLDSVETFQYCGGHKVNLFLRELTVRMIEK